MHYLYNTNSAYFPNGCRSNGLESYKVNLLKESIECMLGGDTKTGVILLRDFANAAIGFYKLGWK